MLLYNEAIFTLCFIQITNNETYLFKDMTHYNKLMFIDIPKEKLEKLHKELNHNNKDIVTCYYDIKEER